MTKRPPRRGNGRSRPSSSTAATPETISPETTSPETISAEKSLPDVSPGAGQGGATHQISGQRETPVALLDRPDDGGTVIAFPEPPARRRRRWWLYGSVATVLVVAGLLAYLVFSPALAVRSLEIQGNQLLAEDQIAAALTPLMGKSLTQVSDEEVMNLLADLPPVQDVSVAASPPSTLSVNVVERVPVAILENGGQFVLIDSEGRQLKSVKDRGSVALPLIDGGENAVNSDVFSSITDVLASLPLDIRERLVHASAGSIDSIELKLTDGKTIFWGSSEGNAAKATVLTAMLTIGEQDPPVKVFDVSTPARPVTR